jgi:enamine deaminase RidA (YjgF/YER057c/UK114 family)
MRRFAAAIAVALLLSACAANPPLPHKTIIVPAGQERNYDSWHFAPALRVGDTVVISGLPAAKGASYEEKVRNMFERLKSTLAAAGADLADVIEIDTFHAQARDSASFDEEFACFAAIHHEYFPDHYPAWTAVGTTALLAEGAVVEMRATAVVGSGKAAEIRRANPAQP